MVLSCIRNEATMPQINQSNFKQMKNVISKFLGLDKIQTESTNLFNEVVTLRDRIKSLELENHKLLNKQVVLQEELRATDWNEVARESISIEDLALSIDMYDLASNIDTSDIAYNIDMNDLACHISTADIAGELDIDDIVEAADLNIDTIAEQVAERIADREGLQHLISEEIDNQGVSSVTTDAVESMIHTAIQQFADGLEVMVSAKLNYNK
jgi:hypothetical protein